MIHLNEDSVEWATLDIFKDIGYEILFGPDIAPDGINPLRELYSDVVFTERLRDAIYKLNPNIPPMAKEEAVKKLLRTETPDLITNNQNFHHYVTEGIDVEYRHR